MADRLPSDKARRRRLSPAVREAQILDVARREFEHRPYEAVTLEEIARSAEVSAALVHHYFGSKQDVFMAVVREAIEGFLGALAPPAASGAVSRPGEAIDAALERYLKFVGERPRGFAFVIGARGAPDAKVAAMIASAREVAFETVLGLLGLEQPTAVQAIAVWGWIGAVEAASTRWLADQTISAGELRALLIALLPT